MPNLEKVVIESTAKSVYADTLCSERLGNAVDVPKPEYITVDSTVMPVFQNPQYMTRKFLDFLFLYEA